MDSRGSRVSRGIVDSQGYRVTGVPGFPRGLFNLTKLWIKNMNSNTCTSQQSYTTSLLINNKNSGMILEYEQKLSKRWKMTNGGEIKYILGIKIIRNRELGYLKISQTNYIENLVVQYNQENSKNFLLHLVTTSSVV